MVEFPASCSQQTGQMASPKAGCGLEHSGLLWLTVALDLMTVTHGMPVSLDCFPVPYFYSERPLINSGLQAGKAYLHDSDPHET